MISQFVRRLLPQKDGLYCAAELLPQGGWKQKFFESFESLSNFCEVLDSRDRTIYISQAVFDVKKIREAEAHNSELPKDLTPDEYKKRRKGRRSQANASWVQNFFFDIDCGPGKPYATQADGYQALKTFCKETALPFPSLVNSGNGLYAHWIIDQSIPADQWKGLASILKRLTLEHKFLVDQSRTADSASVLRPVGVHNRKHGLVKEVKLVHEAPDVPFKIFLQALHGAAHKAKVDTQILEAPTAKKFEGLNDDFTSGLEGPASSLLLVADKCAQVKNIRESLGNVTEPIWYNFIGLARHTKDEGEEYALIHEWSAGHPDYSPEATEDKILQHIQAGFGPTTCGKFAADDPAPCVACPYVNKIKSPIVLGRPEARQLTAEDTGEAEEEFHVPYGFKRAEDGMWFQNEGVWQRFYAYDLFMTRVAYDHSLGYETATVKHKLPHNDGYQEFSLRSSLIHDKKALLMALGDNHVHTSGAESKGHLMLYVESYMTDLRAKRHMTSLHSQMGWRGETGELSFTLGDRIIKAGVAPEPVGFAKNVPVVARALKSEGSFEVWRDATGYLALPGMEAMAFSFLAGAFGAPLLRFTGYAGAMVALVGDSGIGKTLLGEWVMSVYGESTKLILQKEDTKNFLVQRLGLYGSLPLYVDEISNIDSQEFSDLVYRVTQGRDKGRLDRNGSERVQINSWNTLALVSSNHSLMDKLAMLKADSSAEINRMFEVMIRPVKAFGRVESTDAYKTLRSNYGLAGERYIQYLVDNQAQHAEKIDILTRQIDAKTGAKAEERFWSMVAGTAIYGGLIASKLGLIKFSVSPILAWVVDQIKIMRSTKKELVVNQMDFLGQFLDDNLHGALICSHNGPKEMPSILKEPRGNIVYRINTDTHRLIISRKALKTYLDKFYGSYSKLKSELEGARALINADARKVLGAGTYIGGTQTPVWEIDLKVPELGRQALALVQKSVPVELKVVK